MAYFILLAAIGVNFFLAMSEIALVSSRRVRLESLAQQGSRGARIALELIEHPTRFLSVIQAGITLVGIFSGAFGERSIATDIAAVFSGWPLVAQYAGPSATIVVVLLIGFLSLVFGELVPKRLAMVYPETIACLVSRPIRWLSIGVAPVVTVLAFSTSLVLRLLRADSVKADSVTTEEIKGMVAQGMEEGLIHATEQQLVERVLQLGEQSVSALMVPRTEMTMMPVDLSRAEIARIVRDNNRSHYPVCEGDLEHPIGVVHIKDLAHAAMAGEFSLRALMKPPVFVPESMPVLRVMEDFTRRGSHIAFVLDEYGGLSGLITFNDIVEGVMGRASRRPMAQHDPDEITRPDGSKLLDGLLTVARVREITGKERLPREDAGFNTLAGLLMTNLGRIPVTGDRWQWDGHRFEVVDMDGRRVDKVLYSYVPPGTDDAPAPE